MIGLGQIPTIGNTSNRIHEMRLWDSIAKVDRKEAEQGAAHSDTVRLGNKEKQERGVPLKTFLSRVAKFGRSVTRTKEEKKQEDDCPVAQARARSEVGENAPLGWLTLDQMGGQQSGGVELEPEAVLGGRFQSTEEPKSLFSLSEGDCVEDLMFEEEWFLSPCG